MATTRDYIDYLNDQVDIAPANSQEELDAAQLIQSLMEQHALETKIQEFDAPSSGSAPYRIAMMMLFIGLLLSGFYGTPAATVGIVLVFIVAALFLPPRPPGAELVFANGDRRDVRAANLAWSVPPPPLPASALRRLLSAARDRPARHPPRRRPS